MIHLQQKLMLANKRVFDFYMNNIFNMGTVEDDLQRSIVVGIMA